MKQVLQSYRTGELWLTEVASPACPSGGVVVRTRRSVVSAGTEKMVVELARKSLVENAKSWYQGLGQSKVVVILALSLERTDRESSAFCACLGCAIRGRLLRCRLSLAEATDGEDVPPRTS